MLVIISDLHLTDGTSGSTISPGAFQLLRERMTDLAIGASYRRGGEYRPIEQIDLVLLGDVLDVIRSSRWLAQRERPWSDAASPALADVVTSVTGGILAHNAAAFAEFRGLAERGIDIADATRDGRPAIRETVTVPVRTHYMVGNHDWFFHLPGAPYDAIRTRIAEHMGLATNPLAPFPHEPWEDNELLQSLRRHKTFARHGDVHDPFNYEGNRNASSLGDVIVVELLSRFSVQVATELADDLPDSAIAGLREIDNIRPLLLIPVWIDGLLERSCPSLAVRRHVKNVWDELADDFLDHPFVRERDTWAPVDLVDKLQNALKFSRRLSVGWASRIAQIANELRGAGNSSYAQHALGEQDFRNRRARHIVYGHTHFAEQRPLDASFAEGYALQQTYFNSGTWRRVFEPTAFSAAEREFVAADALTYLAFFKDDERGGRPFETWSGTLGLAPDGAETMTRVDRGVRIHGGDEPISTPTVPIRPPHFAVPVAPQRIPGGRLVG